ncbi:MAG TPA: hypothetical protein VK870_12115 [Ignavibacteriaceae bacterium]|nr:hypothetical protein [Ignavibacteriaceae bacterium]
MKKIFLIFTFLFVLILGYKVNAQISPGDLTKAHAHLEGLSNCTKCHQLGQQVLNSKCLDCHTEIKVLINKRSGYHSSSEVLDKDCWSCHSEHHGRNFRIINFDEKKFNHDKTGFKLTGSHIDIECSKCHNSSFIKDPAIKKKNKSFLGLDAKCQSCHSDYHQNTLGEDCLSCHNTIKFRPAENFNHNKARFQLTGIHQNVECSKCHFFEKRNGKDFQKFRELSFSSCSSCHTDIHKGAFGIDCKSCHSTGGFKIINQSAFDHSRTNFPLIGRHKEVQCNDCHKSGLSKKPFFSKCSDCHSDYHRSEFTVNGSVRDCKVCHSESGFSPSSFYIEEHNKLNFKLTGSHLAVPCKNCHLKNDNWHFKNIGINCIDCHNNVHGDELKSEFLPGNKCENCHNTVSWETITFDHNLTLFKLEGKHNELSCSECHVSKDLNQKRIYKFLSVTSECESCHKDVHFGQFIEDGNSDCLRCHTFNNWEPEKFDHNKTRFSLSGAHSKLECSRCHNTVSINDTDNFIQFKLKDFKCVVCHS